MESVPPINRSLKWPLIGWDLHLLGYPIGILILAAYWGKQPLDWGSISHPKIVNWMVFWIIY